MPVELLPHAYTNRTARDGRRVTKSYLGPPAAAERQTREKAALTSLWGRIPVPAVVGGSDRDLQMRFVDGTPGQDVIDAGDAAMVLRACGRMLREIQAVDPASMLPARTGQVLVHGDYGPNNVLIDPTTGHITAVVDWEWVHAGDPIEDLAWCEWIVRMHHPQRVDELDAFFEGYGRRPAWADRQAAMLSRSRELIDFCERWEPGGPGVQTWRRRLAVTARWVE